jgi:transcriptional regulator with XRE-family HTH domain
MFGAFIKEIRTKQRIGLRNFCKRVGYDPSNWSKIEREVMPPPRDNGTLREWAKKLNLKPDSEEWHKFFNYAAMDAGRLPQHVLNGAESQKIKFGSSYSTWCKGIDLTIWAGTLEAQQKLPALVRRLIHGTIENPTLCQFPSDEGTRRHGWDGVLIVERGNAWVPNGQSVWEMGADKDPRKKANEEYTKRSKALKKEAKNKTFVFVTPRKWEGKTTWLKTKRAEKKWLDLLVWDCDDLEQWLETAPAVDAWLARLLGKLPEGVRDLSSYWLSLSSTSEPPLPSSAFLAGRSEAEKQLRTAIRGQAAEIAISATSLAELRDFVSAVSVSGGEESDNAATTRALIVDTANAWNQLCTSKNRLLLIPNDQLVLEKPMVADAVKAGHHVLAQRPYTVIRSFAGIRLPRADRWELQKSLESAGFLETRAIRLAREAGGCTSVLIRLASKFSGQTSPAWSKPNEASKLLPLVLLGAWADTNTDDRKLVENFTGESYDNVLQNVTRWLSPPDAPLKLAEGIYSFVSREDSWQILKPFFTNDLLNRFIEIAKEILSEDDPRFDMEAGERYLAGIYKKLPKFSPQLREGIAETIALLGTRGDNTPQGAPEGSSWRAKRLVNDLLADAFPKRWFSLASNLPLLAEAAPDEFLAVLESALSKPSSPIITLFQNNADGLFSWSPHTSLMWALQILAWDTTYLSRVVLILANLARLDTGGRINPRPSGVLFDIFRSWFPQTSANINERLEVLQLLSKRHAEVAWNLLKGLIPQGHDTAMVTIKPRWRECDCSQAKEATELDISRQTEWAATQLIGIAEKHPEKWPLLLEDFGKLPFAAQNGTLKWLNEVDAKSLPDKTLLEIWEQVRDLIQKHSFFDNAWWALRKPMVDELIKIEKKFTPSNPMIRSKWLFGPRAFEAFGNINSPHNELEQLRIDAQLQAVQEIFVKFGLKGIFEFASDLDIHANLLVGQLLQKTGFLTQWEKLLPDKLVSGKKHEKFVALGYADLRQRTEGAAWVDKLPLEEWPAESVGEFALALPFERKTWLMLRTRKPAAESFYWQRVRPWTGRLDENELEEVVKALLQNGRPHTAVDAIAGAIHFHKKPSWKTVADAIDLASLSPADSIDAQSNRMSVYEICKLMTYLQDDPTGDQKRLAMLEWRLLPLARHDHFKPRMLHAELSESPQFFAEVLSALYREKGKPKDENSDQTKQNLFEAAYSLLESWTRIPGTKSDGIIDSDILNNWVNEVRNICINNNRIEPCDGEIGELLSYSPTEADGSWPCKAIRQILENITTDEIVRGFQRGVWNQRGVTTRGLKDGGEQERQLVIKYRGHAEKWKVSWPRTAVALRGIAEYYENQATWQDEHADARN